MTDDQNISMSYDWPGILLHIGDFYVVSMTNSEQCGVSITYDATIYTVDDPQFIQALLVAEGYKTDACKWISVRDFIWQSQATTDPVRALESFIDSKAWAEQYNKDYDWLTERGWSVGETEAKTYQLAKHAINGDPCLWLEDYLSKQPPPTDKSKSINKTRTGYVYVLNSDSGFYKIGRTLKPTSRIKTFSVKLPYMVTYRLVIKSDDYVQLEKDLHERYSDVRVDGEWFNLTPQDIVDLQEEYQKYLIDIGKPEGQNV